MQPLTDWYTYTDTTAVSQMLAPVAQFVAMNHPIAYHGWIPQLKYGTLAIKTNYRESNLDIATVSSPASAYGIITQYPMLSSATQCYTAMSFPCIRYTGIYSRGGAVISKVCVWAECDVAPPVSCCVSSLQSIVSWPRLKLSFSFRWCMRRLQSYTLYSAHCTFVFCLLLRLAQSFCICLADAMKDLLLAHIANRT